MNSPSPIALFCLLHPETVEKRDRVLHLLGTCYDYRDPAAKTTTWCYFTPSLRAGATSQVVERRMGGRTSAAVAGLELYTDKAALSRQLAHPDFQKYHAIVKAEELYAQPEDLSAWYPRAGFMARSQTSSAKAIVVTVLMEIKDAGKADSALELLRMCAQDVEANEPDLLTYCMLTRPKAPAEILVFERYKNLEAMKNHIAAGFVRKMLKQLNPMIKAALMNEWEELDGTFVGSVIGGGEPVDKGKESSRL